MHKLRAIVERRLIFVGPQCGAPQLSPYWGL